MRWEIYEIHNTYTKHDDYNQQNIRIQSTVKILKHLHQKQCVYWIVSADIQHNSWLDQNYIDMPYHAVKNFKL